MYIIIFIFILIIEILIFLLYKKSAILLSKNFIFPKISKEVVEKFNSFDFHLGWVNKKNTIKKEYSQGQEITYTYNEKGARSIGRYDLKTSHISTYGDSYCLSREVEDNQTWQYFLSSKLDTNILNFGVGNYGLDQSLLRLKQEYPKNPTKIVVMAITPYTITRIVSIWKHFSEFDNILAFKPRFVIENNQLKLIPNIIKIKSDLLNDMENYKEDFEKYDEHLTYFNNHIYKFPFILSFILKPKPVLRVFYSKATSLFRKLKLNNLSFWFLYQYFLPEILYRKRLFIKYEELLNLLVKDFIKYSQENNFKPILLILPTIEDVRYYNKINDKYYNHIFRNSKKEIQILDFMDILSNDSNILRDYYVDSYVGGHYSALGNQKLANFLEEHIDETP